MMTVQGKSGFRAASGLLLVLLTMIGLAGCASDEGSREVAERSFVPTLQIGDSITVVLQDIAGLPAPLKFEDKIKEDGSITLHLNQSFKAEGKTALQLQQEIYARYVPDYYGKLTVSVQTADQYYTVTGYVKAPSQYKYVGPTTLTKAIATAGYFTDFGSHTVILIRAGGQKEKWDYDKIMKQPGSDPQIFPGDTIQVPRRRILG